MTPELLAHFTARLEHWRLALGLHEWRVIVTEDASIQHCEVTPQIKYLRVLVRVAPGFPADEMEDCARHEMTHVLLAEFSNWAASLLPYIGHVEREPLHDAWELAWERTAERLSRLLEAKR